MTKKIPSRKTNVNPVKKENSHLFLSRRKFVQEEFSRWIFCITGSLLLYGIIAFIVSKIYNPDIQAIIDNSKEISFHLGFNPEPKERLLYVLGILITPLSLLFFYTLSLKKIYNSFFKKKNSFYGFIILTIAVITALLYFTFQSPNPLYAEKALHAHDINMATNFDFYFYQTSLSNYFWTYTIVIVPLVALFYYSVFRKLNGKTLKISNSIISVAGYVFSSLLVLAIVKMNIYDFPVTWQAQYDFNAVYYSVTQVCNGSQMLTENFTNTYGLYPHFLKPVFEIFGLSIYNFTVVMSVLIGISFASIFIFMRKFIADKLLLFLGFISTLFLPYLYNRLVTDFDSYFAVFPIRIFPVTLILLFTVTWFIVKKEKWKKAIYYAGMIVSSFGILWNPDFGMIAFISWVLLHLYIDFYTEDKKIAWKKILQHLIVGVGAVLLAFAGYAFLQKIIYGTTPQLSLMFSSMTVFSQLGFYMIPMQLIHPWMIVILCFTIGLTYSMVSFFKKTTTPKSAVIFLVSILGFGTFAYFQGRSHNWNLTVQFLFFFICLTLLVDELWKTIKEYDVKSLYFVFAIGLYCLTFSTIDVFAKSRDISKLAQQDFSIAIENSADKTYGRIKENVKFIDERVQDSEKILVFTSDKDLGFYYNGKNKRSAVNPAFIELFYRSDLQKYINTIQDSSYKIFYDLAEFNNYHCEGIRAAIAANYVLKGCVYDTTTVVFAYLEKQTKKIPEKSFFSSRENTLFHEKYSSDSLGCAKRIAAAYGYQNVKKRESYSIEILLYPEKQMKSGAMVLTNVADTSGFFMNFMSLNVDDDYKYLVGFNGLGYFVTLESEKWNYVVFEIHKSNLIVYLNGMQVIRAMMKDDYRHPDEAKLFIGNWHTRSNYFGLISEIAITDGMIPSSDITTVWNHIKEINP